MSGQSYWKARKMGELGWEGGNWVVKAHKGAGEEGNGLTMLLESSFCPWGNFATCLGWAPAQVHQAATLKGRCSSSGFFTFSCFIEILSISPHLLLVLPDYWVSYSSVSKRLNCPLEKAITSWRRRSHFHSILQETESLGSFSGW